MDTLFTMGSFSSYQNSQGLSFMGRDFDIGWKKA